MPLREMRSLDSPVMSSPLNRMRPEEGRRTPVRQLKKVLLPAPFGPMMARISSRPTSKLTQLSAARPPKRTVNSSVRRSGADAPRPTAGEHMLIDASAVTEGVSRYAVGRNSEAYCAADWRITRSLSSGRDPVANPPTARAEPLGSGELASRREQRLLLLDRLHDPMLAALDLEEELAHERLVILLAEHLVALREVVAFLHLQAFERLDQLHGVLAAAEARFLHAELQGIHRLIVRLHVAVGQRTGGIDLLEADAGVFQEPLMCRRIERTLENRNVSIDADEAFDLVAERRQVGRLGDGAVSGPFVLPGQTEIVCLIADSDPVRCEDGEEPIKVPADLGQERRHVGGAKWNAGRTDDFAARFPDLVHIGIARRLTPRVVCEDNVPFLTHLVDEIGRERHRLRGSVIERAEGVAIAFARRQRGVEAHADHVDDPGFFPDRHAREAYVGEEAADLHVDLVLDHQLLCLAAADIGLGLIVGDQELNRAAVDAAGIINAVRGHLHADQRGLAAHGPRAGKRLYGADLVRLGLAESGSPRCRHQYGCAQHAAAPSHQAATGHLAAVPERV